MVILQVSGRMNGYLARFWQNLPESCKITIRNRLGKAVKGSEGSDVKNSDEAINSYDIKNTDEVVMMGTLKNKPPVHFGLNNKNLDHVYIGHSPAEFAGLPRKRIGILLKKLHAKLCHTSNH